MNKFDRENKVKELREKYPSGTWIRLISMDDEQAPPKGTIGIVTLVDDMGNIHVNWSTGSTLGLVPEEDEFEVIPRLSTEQFQVKVGE